jgi:hypothetical protein
MSGILAIEPDPQRQARLMTLIREHVQAEITMVDSVRTAIQKFDERQPELIVAPALLPPGDSSQLTKHVQEHAQPHVQMLTIAALDLLREEPANETRGIGLFRRWQPVSLGLQYDPVLVGRQIADGLARAQALRTEQANFPARRLVKRDAAQPSRPALRPAHATESFHDRRWAERTAQRALPWLWAVRLPWGADVDLVNISRTGVLLESGSKVSPGVTLELQLSGMGLNRIVMARFIRSEIARVDRLGVRYHAAAQFEQPLDILAPETETPSTSQPLAELFTSVLSESNQLETPSIRFARGLRRLLGVQDVLIRRTPVAPAKDCESIYFRVKGDERSGAILQVLFDRDRALTATEFRLLKAAAGLTSAVLELERESTENVRSAGPTMAAVA